MKYYLDMFAKGLDFRGKASFKEFWMATLYNLIFAFCAELLALPFAVDLNVFLIVASSLASLYGVITFIPSFALMVRRLHDTGHSAWYIFVAFIPLIGEFLLIFTLCQPSAFRVDPMFDDYKTHTDKTYNDTYKNEPGQNLFGKTVDENLKSSDSIKKDEDEFENIKNYNNKDTNKKSNDDIIKVDESQISISSLPKKTRLEQIKECQQLLNDGLISKEEYDRRVLKILSN